MSNLKIKLKKDELITRLTRELYDLKQKLESIRMAAEEIEKEQHRSKGKQNKQIQYLINDILNAIDEGEIYETR